MLHEWRYTKFRNTVVVHQRMQRLKLFMRRNLLELVCIGLFVMLTVVSGIAAETPDPKIRVSCQVVDMKTYNVTDVVLERLQHLEIQTSNADLTQDQINDTWSESNTNSPSETQNEPYTQSNTLSISSSASESASNDTNPVAYLMDPFWLFDVYCIFARLDSNHKEVTNVKTDETLIVEQVMYMGLHLVEDQFGVGTRHECYYNYVRRQLTFYNTVDTGDDVGSKHLEKIVFGFCFLLMLATVYYLYDKERNYKPQIVTECNGIDSYIDDFNGHLREHNSDYASTGSDGNQIIELIPAPTRHSTASTTTSAIINNNINNDYV
jgi:hypothetical protein